MVQVKSQINPRTLKIPLCICRIVVACLLGVLAFPAPLSAQPVPEGDMGDVDTVLHDYHLRCQAAISSPAVLAMADTLFRMAGERGDRRMQAVALCDKLDYYYYRGLVDSVVVHTRLVQEFATKTGQPQYYYFVWSKRLIRLYLKQGMTATALWEAQHMLETASKNNDQEGMANCYNALSTIYDLKSMGDQAVEYKLREIDLIKKYDLNAYNISVFYCDIAKWHISYGRLAVALETLQEAQKHIIIPSHYVVWLCQAIRYQIACGNLEKAGVRLGQLRELFDSNPALAVDRKDLYIAEYDYYRGIGDIPGALGALKRKEAELNRTGDESTALLDNRERGMLYYERGEHGKAAEYFRDYIFARDSLFVMVEQNTSAEFAALFETERLRGENNALTIAAQHKRLQSRYLVIIILAVSLTVISVFFLRAVRYNKRLLYLGKELRTAKHDAEQANAIKSSFIGNMSHEVRTPLNAIVGFSQLLAELSPQEEAREYIRIVHENNRKLLKLFDEVLVLSDLDAGRTFKEEPVDLNACCADSVKNAAHLVNEGVELRLDVPDESLCIFSNPTGIALVLSNLLSNAAKATRSGNIVMGYAPDKTKEHVLLWVTDTGPGIPDEKRQQIFDRFSKLDDFAPGLGLGLAISSLMALKLGGSLTLDPEYTGGCRFVLALPFVDR